MESLAGVDAATLLGPLCAAADALARLDACVVAAPDAIRDGLIARMAFTEAAGWLARAHAWVHPLDLALRDLDLTGSTALAATGGGHRVLPHTFAIGNRSASGHTWGDRTFDAVAEGDRAVADALALARLLPRLPGAPGTARSPIRRWRQRSPRSAPGRSMRTGSPDGGPRLRRRHRGCGGRAGKVELLTGIEGASSRPVRKIVLRE
jgi:hypothetical protein